MKSCSVLNMWKFCPLAAMLLLPTGCVRRSMTITTEPQGALVYLNDEEVGRSDVTVDFLWYGDYDVVLRKEGYQTLATHWKIDAPWYQLAPLDFFAEILWPGHILDAHTNHFVLEPEQLPTVPELQERAFETRARALGIDQTAQGE